MVVTLDRGYIDRKIEHIAEQIASGAGRHLGGKPPAVNGFDLQMRRLRLLRWMQTANLDAVVAARERYRGLAAVATAVLESTGDLSTVTPDQYEARVFFELLACGTGEAV